ncbi:YesL family protein [Brachybacterium hainanense]|uniref:YesL family protein n=1 Tax=Brachybacterium hainanense TaxID=1541174 RepID=A0ABV6RCA6_9MICO
MSTLPAAERAPSAAAAPGGSGPRLGGLVRWHVRAGELGLRLFLLHLLWVLGTLAGGVVVGVFPATAALHAVLRSDQHEAALEREDRLPPSRPGLWHEFWSAWRTELVRANTIGLVLVLLWGLLAADRAVVLAGVGAATPLVSGLVVALTVATLLLSATIWPLAAHFADPLPRLWRMAMLLLLSRPALTLSIGAVLAASVWLLGRIPGLIPVFGIALTCWAISALIWRSGVLPRA